jgi:hypothetical protein
MQRDVKHIPLMVMSVTALDGEGAVDDVRLNVQ